MFNIYDMKKTLIIAYLWLCQASLIAQSYDKWINGDTSNVTTTAHQGGLVLAGGGADNDNAMKWLLSRAAGGDVVVIRASGSNGYNSYLFSQLGIPVNSVETIRFNNIQAASDPYVINRIRNAEALFIAGGDQYDYYQFWKDNAIEDAINYLINEKKVTVGGTSAGMAILGDAYYTPPGSSLTSEQALANPFHSNTNIIGKDDFIQAPFMSNLITDTHYDQRTRQGRHVTFLARIAQAYGERSFGIACNEGTAVCVDTAGIAHVFGEYPQYNEIAYFLKSNCQEPFLPEIIQTGTPLTWNRQQAAVKVYKVPGQLNGAPTFNLNTWEDGTGGMWENWYVEQGVLLKVQNTAADCDLFTPVKEPRKGMDGQIIPNPFLDTFFLKTSEQNPLQLRLFDVAGKMVWEKMQHFATEPVEPEGIRNGVYWLEVRGERTEVLKLVKAE